MHSTTCEERTTLAACTRMLVETVTLTVLLHRLAGNLLLVGRHCLFSRAGWTTLFQPISIRRRGRIADSLGDAGGTYLRRQHSWLRGGSACTWGYRRSYLGSFGIGRRLLSGSRRASCKRRSTDARSSPISSGIGPVYALGFTAPLFSGLTARMTGEESASVHASRRVRRRA
jgi:hypothetical protein